jgi:phosphatidate cytidylyltransferase
MTSSRTSSGKHADLRQRLVTALVLAATVLSTVIYGSNGLWALVVSVFCLAAAWEAGRLSKLSANMQVVQFGLVGAIILALWFLFLRFGLPNEGISSIRILLFAAAVFWILIAPLQLSSKRIHVSVPWGFLIWPLVIGAAWISAVAVVVITIVADVAAYFVGRRFGRVKLAPSISPGKTREGALGGIVAAGIWTAIACNYLDVTSGTLQGFLAALIGALLGAFAVMGDLWESQLKRQAGVKDSSNLLPGHGGVLDRIDAQLVVLPLATVVLSTVKALW